jgi:uncharacterized protein
MRDTFTRVPMGTVRLLPVVNRPGSTPSFSQRAELNRTYVMSLANEHLLQNHYVEAGLWHTRGKPEGIHWGWESPTCQLRGHFLGHWLSAAARIWASTGDFEVKAKADRIVSELDRCQRENGGEWVFAIPEKYLHWIARGKRVWAPQYVVHKTLMGLYDMVAFAQNEQALEIMTNAARWFHRWTGQFSREELDDILDVETGGMLEAWADLYGATGHQEHLDLVQRYDRPRLFDRLLAGEDALTNQHANTTIPEAHGAARAWEVTGERRWRDIAFAYWDQAVTKRGSYATGGQSCGEFWTAPNELSARLGSRTQEHCTVYNMMRLAEYLLRWTGDVQYADYWERNLVNGILAQQHPTTGMISYFLPMNAGATKEQTKLPRMEKTYWGSPTEDFWCCHGSLVQAHSAHGASAYFQDEEGLVITQYIPTELNWEWHGVAVKVTQTLDPQLDKPKRPECLAFDVAVESERSVEFTLKIRLPWWLRRPPTIVVNGTPVEAELVPSSYWSIRRTWQRDRLHVELPKGLTTSTLPDRPDMVAFMDGPVVLAGLCDEERTLCGDTDHPETMLVPDNEREWRAWQPGYRTRNQARGIRFLPLYEIVDERYTVYFPVVSSIGE